MRHSALRDRLGLWLDRNAGLVFFACMLLLLTSLVTLAVAEHRTTLAAKRVTCAKMTEFIRTSEDRLKVIAWCELQRPRVAVDQEVQ